MSIQFTNFVTPSYTFSPHGEETCMAMRCFIHTIPSLFAASSSPASTRRSSSATTTFRYAASPHNSPKFAKLIQMLPDSHLHTIIRSKGRDHLANYSTLH